MLFISEQGIVDAERVKVTIFPEIERGSMDKVNGIVVHQTAAEKISSTFHSYKDKGANGAHFLIDKDGTIYQTASLKKRANHVGRLRSRCLEEKTCNPAEFKRAYALSEDRIRLSIYEHKNTWPSRYPSNYDSVGIELVGDAIGKKGEEVFERVTDAQNKSLTWLVKELTETLNIITSEIYRHPEISYKNPTESSTAKWE